LTELAISDVVDLLRLYTIKLLGRIVQVLNTKAFQHDVAKHRERKGKAYLRCTQPTTLLIKVIMQGYLRGVRIICNEVYFLCKHKTDVKA